ncbi:hypothetical protein DICPUDRAFT_58152 [Dictyostelium purpureum]|uniref:YbaK/aminoacyl-tRNA synthetase-associated domain-containing protein n=1 Tax=Dictyostelium purpureum TaxID=5786 RepID=F0ZZD9_DICPU|nr:uncharacterized protein DICPUDRAFT_58152 [Dictyostelium purpureum]EGC30682.1 hypothetical protein DICPUDRAFT_58152 [Dictyostelium purpureum]|eukprot:XP_003292780.1 hypothetical protein DICPUDRAFT_58152 [Dictyostelium purpureum]
MELLEKRQNEILNKLNKLVEKIDDITPSSIITDNQKRISKVCDDIGLDHKLERVPRCYYNWKLEERANYLNAPSSDYLCKSLIFENTECVNSDTSIQTNSRYYCVIIQYTTKIQSHKIFKFIKSLNQQESAKKFHFTLAPSEISQQLTGFEYNAVCPLGTNVNIPVIISKQIMELPNKVVWLGGGEVDLKLIVDIHKFKERMESNGTSVFVTDVIDNSSNETDEL